MKSAIALCLTALLLTACAPERGSLTTQAVKNSQADVPPVSVETQKKAAEEILGGSCPALTHLANVCLVTRDQVRALKK